MAVENVTPDALGRIDETLRRLDTGAGLSGDAAATFARAVIDALEAMPGTEQDPVKQLFQRRSRDEERFIASCLLRLLATAPRLFDDPRFGNRAQQLLDRAIPDIYKELRLQPKQQTYEKHLELRDVVPNCERTVHQRASALVNTDASALRARREPLVRSLKRAKKVLGHAIPDGTEADVASLIDAAAEVLEAPPETRLAMEDAYRNRRDLVSKRFEHHGSVHAADIGARVVAALDEAILRHREAHPLTPAIITVRSSMKKYPLREEGRSFRARLLLENDSRCAAREAELEVLATAGISFPSPTVYLGSIASGVAEIELDAVADPADLPSLHAQLIGRLTWRNLDGSRGTHEFECDLQVQAGGIDWGAAGDRSPYTLSPLTDPDQLVGRNEMLQALEAGIAGDDSLSFLITGQKRVGKTSLVQVLAERLKRRDIAIPAYVQVGTYADDPAGLARGMARALRAALRGTSADSEAVELVSEWLATYQVPKFSDLFDLIDDLLSAGRPGSKLVVVLDEFDELPTALYQQSDEARAFFNTLRSLMILRDVSVILVGGERTNFVLAPHGQALNLLKQQRLDGFGSKDEVRDFADLVRHPTVGLLEYTDHAVDALLELTGGHPFYARMICAALYREMIDRRDSSITPREVGDAAALVLDTASMTNFAHYWEDGILEVDGARRQEVRQQRVRLLVALARSMSRSGVATSVETEQNARGMGIESAVHHQLITSFEQRRVIQHDRDADTLLPNPPIFARWLAEHGVTELITAVPDQEAQFRSIEQRAEARVKAGEMATLVRQWPVYRGRSIESDRVRAWLEQFGDEIAQRRAFNVLRSLTFVSDGLVRTAFRDMHRSLMAGRARTPATRAKFRDVLVVSPDPPGKSGPVYARLYAQETSTHQGNICDLGQLPERLSGTTSDIRFIVVVNDFIGTGESTCDRLNELQSATLELIARRGIQMSILVYAATEKGLRNVEDLLEAKGLDWIVRSHVTFGEDARAFAPESDRFETASEREAARALFHDRGASLVPRDPMGFGQGELALVFENNIPNNSLPPLWSTGPGWEPLFPRL